MVRARTVEQVRELVAKRYEDLSPQLKSAARFLLDHPDDVALSSMRELAQAAKLPPVTFVRLARALGFAGYSELHALHQRGMRDGWGSRRYSFKARELQFRGHAGDMSALLEDLFGAEMENVKLTFEMNGAAGLTRGIELIEAARRIHVLGQRSCYPASYFFHYVYGFFRDNSVLLQSQGGPVADELRGVGADDLLLVISMSPYAADVVHAVDYARDRGIRVLAITDGSLSPVARAADQALMIAADTPSFFRSMVSTQALLQALLALLVARGGKKALAAIENRERQLAYFKVYWSDGRSRRTNR